MNERELLALFTSAAFPGGVEEKAFVDEARLIKPAEALKLLEVVSNRALAQKDPGRHIKRLKLFSAVAEGWSDKTLFLPFVRALRTADAPLKNVLADAIPHVRNPDALGELAGLLRGPEPQLRAAAARSLINIGGRTVFDLVGTLVAEPPFPGRLEAMDILIALAPQHALPSLRAVLTVGNLPEKLRAIQHIASPPCSSKDPQACAATIAPWLDDPTESLAVAATAALCDFATEDDYFKHVVPALDGNRLEIVRIAVQGLSRFGSARATRLLSRKLRKGQTQ